MLQEEGREGGWFLTLFSSYVNHPTSNIIKWIIFINYIHQVSLQTTKVLSPSVMPADYVTLPQPHPISYLSALLHSSITLAKIIHGDVVDWFNTCLCVCVLQEEMRQSVAPAEPVQYYFTLAQQPGAVQVQGTQQGQQAGAQTATTIQPGQIIITQPQQGQVQSSPRLKSFVHHTHWSMYKKIIQQWIMCLKLCTVLYSTVHTVNFPVFPAMLRL